MLQITHQQQQKHEQPKHEQPKHEQPKHERQRTQTQPKATNILGCWGSKCHMSGFITEMGITRGRLVITGWLKALNKAFAAPKPCSLLYNPSLQCCIHRSVTLIDAPA